MTPESSLTLVERVADARARITSLEAGFVALFKKLDRIEGWIVAALGAIALDLLVHALK